MKLLRRKLSQAKQTPSSGFTLLEILVAAVIGAAVVTAAVLGFSTVSGLTSRGGTVNVQLPGSAIADFYGTDSSFVTIGPNPNYFQAAQARRMKDRLFNDVSSATAVFCLGRNFTGSTAIRPTQLPAVDDFRLIDSPDTFRDSFEEQLGEFPSGQSGALLWATNASIFVLGTLDNIYQTTNNLAVVAIYEMDFVPTSVPAGGTFASVRRYSGTNMAVPTDYFHVYYPGETNGAAGFRPLAAYFSRLGSSAGAFAVATNYPFTFVWWPDPTVSRLEGAAVPSASGVLRDNYSNMAGRTSLFFVLPAFPPL